MRFNVRCDMEGVTGVTCYDQVVPGRAQYEEGRNALMHDLLAVIDGILSVDPSSEIILFDEHFDGRNVRVLELPRQVRYVSGKPPYSEKSAGLIEGCDGMFLVGFHAKMGTPGALMPHTYEHEILDLNVSGHSLGEVGLEAVVAGEAGVPTLFYGGDSAGAEEIRTLIPDLVAVSVKQSMGADAAVCLSGEATAELLRQGAAQAVRKRGEIPPLRLGSPVILRVRLQASAYRTALQQENPGLFEDAEWVRIEAETVTQAYSQYWLWKMRARGVGT